MTADPRAALSTLMSALERHLEAAASRRGDNDPVVVSAYQEVADAFEAYDDALLDAYGEVTPLEVYSGEEDDEEDEDDDDLEDDEEDEDDDDLKDDEEDDDLEEDEEGDDEDDDLDEDDEFDDDDGYVGMGDDDVDFEDRRR